MNSSINYGDISKIRWRVDSKEIPGGYFDVETLNDARNYIVRMLKERYGNDEKYPMFNGKGKTLYRFKALTGEEFIIKDLILKK